MKWACVAVCPLIGAVDAASQRWVVARTSPVGHAEAVWGGRLHVYSYGGGKTEWLLRRYHGPFHWQFEWRTGRRGWYVTVPLWAPMSGAGALAMLGFWLDRASRFAGWCATCGYDLSGLPGDDGVVMCPECGRVSAGGRRERGGAPTSGSSPQRDAPGAELGSDLRSPDQ